LSYWQLSQVFQEAGFQTLLFRKGQPKCAEFEQNRAASSLHQTRNFGTDWLLCFEMRAAPRRVFRRSRPNFTLSDAPVKIIGEGKCWAGWPSWP